MPEHKEQLVILESSSQGYLVTKWLHMDIWTSERKKKVHTERLQLDVGSIQEPCCCVILVWFFFPKVLHFRTHDTPEAKLQVWLSNKTLRGLKERVKEAQTGRRPPNELLLGLRELF